MAKPKKNAPPIPPAHAPDDGPPRPPLWETLAMIAAFVLLWLWFGAHKAAQSANAELGRAWTAALLLALGAMALVMVRRVQRFQRALHETQQQMRRGPSMPWMPPDRNRHN